MLLEQEMIGEVTEVTEATEITVRKNMGPLTIIALAFNVCNSWVGIGSSLAVAIAAGGTVTLVYGVIVASAVYACAALSLAEMASVWPTAGGQYHFASIIAPQRYRRGISYFCGAIAIFSWIAIGAAATILAAQTLIAIPAFFLADYVPQQWQYFVVYEAINVLFLIYNIYGLRRMPWVNDVGFILSLATFVVVIVTCLSIGTKSSSSFVWTDFTSTTGWDQGVTFMTGLTTPCLMFAGIDAALHLAEEVTEPRRTVPQALMVTVGIASTTGFAFAVSMAYCITDLNVLTQSAFPIYELWFQATRSSAASTVFIVCMLLALFFLVNAVQHTTSRLIWAFGRDKGLVFSDRFARIHDKLEVPVWALLGNALGVLIFGCVYLGSSDAFDSILNSCIALQMISFAIPCGLLLYHGRNSDVLPPDRLFRLPNLVGWLVNIVTIGFSLVETVFFCLPSDLPVTGSTMNYVSAVFAVMALFGLLNWIFSARKHYEGPSIQLHC